MFWFTPRNAGFVVLGILIGRFWFSQSRSSISMTVIKFWDLTTDHKSITTLKTKYVHNIYLVEYSSRVQKIHEKRLFSPFFFSSIV
jgi:hypothetical protein